MIASAPSTSQPRSASPDPEALLGRLAEAILAWEKALFIEFNSAWFSENHIQSGTWVADWFEVQKKDRKHHAGDEHQRPIKQVLDEIKQIGREFDVTLTHVAIPGYPGDVICAWWTDVNRQQHYARASLPAPQTTISAQKRRF